MLHFHHSAGFGVNNLLLCVASYGRVYTTDPYHALAPAAAAYGVGAMVRTLTQAP